MPNKFPEIRTSNLLLRQITKNDLDNIFKGLSDPEVIKYYGVSYDSREATKEQMRFFSDLEKNETGIWWAICSPQNKTFYGAGGLNNLSKIENQAESMTHRKAEIGLWLLPEFWGKGIMQEAMPLICQYGFDKLDLHRIEGFVETNNRNCKKVMSKLDFVHEGTMEDCEIKNGEFISLDVFASIKDEHR